MSTTVRLPVPVLRRISEAGDVLRAAQDHDRLRRLALGFEPSETRARAIVELARTDAPTRIRDLEAILGNEATPARLRHLAAMQLGQIDAQGDTPSAGSTAMSAIIGKYPDVKAVFAFNDNTAVSASTVARSSQSHVLICGNTGDTVAFKAIESGAMACTVRGGFYGMGQQVVRAAYNKITGQDANMPESVIITQTLVTKANVGSVEALK